MSDELRVAPTTTGASSGVDAGTPWAFEPADEHWRLHDQREVVYWRSRPPEERLAQALRYRVRVHGPFSAPARWSCGLSRATSDLIGGRRAARAR